MYSPGNGPQESPNCGACEESVEHVLFQCTPRDILWLEYLKHVLVVMPLMLSFLCNGNFNRIFCFFYVSEL